MSRTPLMRMLKAATRHAALEARAADTRGAADGLPLSRRDVLAGAAAAGAALLVPLPSSAAQPSIAIVGAGLAGLTASHVLKTRFGLNADVFEGNSRVGGRCFSARGIFAENQIAEHGGELIDT